MSVINEMLRELDRRDTPSSGAMANQVRPVRRRSRGEWFWRMLAVLLAVAFAWVAWVAYEIRPRALATPLAYQAAESGKRQAPSQVQDSSARAAKPAPVSSSPAQAQVTPAPVEKDKPAEKEKRADKDKPVEPPAARAPDLFKLAQSIDTPIERLVTPEPQKNATREPSEKPPAPRPLQVVKRERPTTPEQKADAAFRRGVAQMNAARISEAQASFAAALEADPAHVASRQALVAILLERGDMDTAQALLQRGLELRPGDVRFATVLARILVEREEFERAAEVLASCPDGAGHLEHQMLYGAVLQRLGRHTQALHAFENAQRLGAPPSATLVAMGVSYERLGQTADAVRVYQQSLTAQAPDEVRLYAEGRIRALR